MLDGISLILWEIPCIRAPNFINKSKKWSTIYAPSLAKVLDKCKINILLFLTILQTKTAGFFPFNKVRNINISHLKAYKGLKTKNQFIIYYYIINNEW